MMSNLIRCTQTAFWIEKGWLVEYATNKNAYLDMGELASRRGNYFDWLVHTKGRKWAESRAADANFTVTSIRVNDTDHYKVNCQMQSEKTAHVRIFAPGLTHPNAITRVYAHNTTPRDGLELTGVCGAVS